MMGLGSCKKNSLDFLTSEEQLWLDQHRNGIEFLSGYEAPPNAFHNEKNEYTGFLIDFQKELESRLKCRFSSRNFDNWNDLVEYTKTGRNFIVVGMASTGKRKQHLLFTDPFIKIPYVLVTHKTGSLQSIADLKGRTVCTVSAYAINDYLSDCSLELNPLKVSDDLEGLRAVSTGQYDAMIINQMYASYLIEQQAITNLKIVEETDYQNRLASAVSKKDQILFRIIDKATDQISISRRKAIYRKWVHDNSFRLSRSTWIIINACIGVVTVLLISLWGWSLSLKKQVDKKTQELKAGQKHLKTILMRAPVPIIVLYNARHSALLNEQFTLQFGYRQEECQTPEQLWNQIFPDPLSRRKVLNYLKTHAPPYNPNNPKGKPREWNLIARDGSIREVELNMTVFDQISVLTIHDLTQQNRTQRERLKLGKLESMGVLAGGIAHDFNNFLTSMFGNLELAGKQLPAGHKSHRFLAVASKAMQQATALTKQLLTFSKEGSPLKETLNIEQLIRETAYFYLHGSAIKLKLEIASDVAPVLADKGQISQVISNLIINAKQAMPEGGHLRISAGNSGKQPGFVQISLTDEGTGIAPTHLKKIFDPYFSTKPTGNGLGLTSVHSIITRHGGSIAVESTSGKGTTFTLLLPADTLGKIENDPNEPEQENKIPAKVLVMDDEESIRTLISIALGESGATVEEAAEGTSAVALYRKAFEKHSPFNAVILDLTIPGGMGGKHAAKEILTIDPNARLIASSGYSNDPVMKNFSKFGFSATIEKPYRLSLLNSIVQQVLSQNEMRTSDRNISSPNRAHPPVFFK